VRIDQLIEIERPLYKKEIMELINSVRAWPAEDELDYSPGDWRRLIAVALRLQREEPEIVAFALEDYTTHFSTSFKPGIDYVSEWSKMLLILRTMFAVPHSGKAGARPGEWRLGGWGFSWVPIPGKGALPVSDLVPLSWSDAGPALAAWQSGYNGGAPAPQQEFWAFKMMYGYRKDLRALLERDHVRTGG
jgi:hypothetical protein